MSSKQAWSQPRAGGGHAPQIHPTPLCQLGCYCLINDVTSDMLLHSKATPMPSKSLALKRSKLACDLWPKRCLGVLHEDQGPGGTPCLVTSVAPGPWARTATASHHNKAMIHPMERYKQNCYAVLENLNVKFVLMPNIFMLYSINYNVSLI